MITINDVTQETLENIYQTDKQAFDDFVNSKTHALDFYALKRLVLSELTLKNSVRPNKILNFTRKQILNMCQYPEKYGKHIIRLMNTMYQKSGYIKRTVDYFANMAKAKYYVDTEFLNSNAFSKSSYKSLKNNYLKFCAQASKFNMSNHINTIIRQLILHDVCFAYVIDNDVDTSYYFLDPSYCEITGVVNGNNFQFSINRSLLTNSYIEEMPDALKNLIESSYDTSLNNMVPVPYENSFCLKYHEDFLYLFPPFFPMIADVLLIDEYKDLSKTKAINDAYKLLVLKIPTKDGKLTMDDGLISPFIETALKVVQENIGVLPYPDTVDSVEFTSTNSDDRDKVSDAVNWAFSETGVSQALMSGSTSGSELKLSITNDSGDIFRIYRMIENWISLQMKLRGFIYRNYQFVYKLLDITIFNQQDVIDSELKLAQASIPNKQRLCAATGMSPGEMIGNIIIENDIFGDVFNKMQPLKSSYTQSVDSESGRPLSNDDNLSESGETTRDNDTNNPENRI